MNDRADYGRPGWVSMQAGSEPQDFPDDSVIQDQNAEEATAKARSQGRIRRRPNPNR